MAALDLSEVNAGLGEVLRETVGRIMTTAPGARLACVNVIKTSRLRIDNAQDESGRNLHVRRLVETRQWAAGLSLPSEQVTAHVLEAVDPAAALIDFARENHDRPPDRDRRRLSRSPNDRAGRGADRRSGPLHGHAGAAAPDRGAWSRRGRCGDGAGFRVRDLKRTAPSSRHCLGFHGLLISLFRPG